MSVENLTWGENFYYEHDSDYHQALKEIVISMGKCLMRPQQFTTEIFSGMDGYLNMIGPISGRSSYRRRYREING